MSPPRAIAFYAPLKSPNHPSPSGDRTMARLLMRALETAGFSVSLASELRTLDKTGDPTCQEQLRMASAVTAEDLVHRYRAEPREQRPALWFTYHVYYKAPDWIGPRVADALAIPYVIAEGSRAAKRADGPWALGHAGAEAALDRANAVIAMTDRDRIALAAAKPDGQRLIDLAPFIDAGEWDHPRLSPRENGAPRLLTVAMMRPGDKLASYRILAASLGEIRHHPWTLDIVGDGDARRDVEELFCAFTGRVRFHGHMTMHEGLGDLYRHADLFVWPAVNEAYGMVLLEAQLFGCPVVAGAHGGVANVVRHMETGILTPPDDVRAFAEAVGSLLQAPEQRRRLGAAAYRFVQDERSFPQASAILRETLNDLIERSRP
ncbi:glycosyltransferase family 4 protein [Microvirga rosea]|uniref:glycosyltransferase family 4 protein n=1 Tax=Microvirga rosea TaxID=2715425 RepID=UPI001D0A1E49|nr:glycosyltransferase family 4 protein [Microvirga rosea]MCB8820137.1 glycosyltransferase family 4 protein [Microvirga rosea]